jgi:MoaA/NifB/PqqE/SkfB family radical SAM enzyme
MKGRSLDAYGAPLFFAWQLTNRCEAQCLACCEESGPSKGWRDELNREESLDLTRQIIDLGIPYVAFGGGEPLSVLHCWDIFQALADAGIAIKLETNGIWIDDAAADRLQALKVECIQISVDGASKATHEMARPGSSYDAALAAIDRLTARGMAPQIVFTPTLVNIHEIVPAYQLAVQRGCGAFVTGPLMRLGRAAAAWDLLACDEATWEQAADDLRQCAAKTPSATVLSIYPWDILTELDRRLDSPQAMVLVVPNGKVKLLNALPFAAADIRQVTLAQAWNAYRAAWRTATVHDFIRRCRTEPNLLQHANETWDVPEARQATGAAVHADPV